MSSTEYTITQALHLGLSSNWRYQEAIEVEIHFSISGQHRPATRWEPAEEPELEIHSVLAHGLDISGLLDSAGLSEALVEVCWGHAELEEAA
jgi:hypothetical protein